jgi:nitroimidazol reductase NimA-like FMN-containing flavoprotein (pyridoxamine 5'-phosphate oxidase superfamily)
MTTWPDQRGSEVLSRTECHRLLGQTTGVGHLGLVVDGKPVVVPLNFVLLGDDILLRLGPGTTLDTLLNEPIVAFEVDEVDQADPEAPEAWSVLIQGSAHVVRDPLDLERAVASGLTPLVAEPGEAYVVVRKAVVSGRRFSVSGLGRFSLRPPATKASTNDVL